MVEIESGSVLEMKDASSAEVVTELNQKLKRSVWWPWVAIIFGVGLWAIGNQSPMLLAAVAVVGLAATWVVRERDVLRTTTVLLYELDDDQARRFQGLHDAFDELARAGRVGHIGAEGGVKDRKRNAGASSVVRRVVVRPNKCEPRRIKANIEIPALPVGRQTLHFFPDRLLVMEPRAAGAVSYHDLQIDIRQTRFIERNGVPSDAKVVDRTWAYVNKNGGPDRRFKQNPEIPIALYEELHCRSASGLNEVVQVSKLGVGAQLQSAIQQMVTAEQQRGESASRFAQ